MNQEEIERLFDDMGRYFAQHDSRSAGITSATALDATSYRVTSYTLLEQALHKLLAPFWLNEGTRVLFGGCDGIRSRNC